MLILILSLSFLSFLIILIWTFWWSETKRKIYQGKIIFNCDYFYSKFFLLRSNYNDYLVNYFKIEKNKWKTIKAIFHKVSLDKQDIVTLEEYISKNDDYKKQKQFTFNKLKFDKKDNYLINLTFSFFPRHDSNDLICVLDWIIYKENYNFNITEIKKLIQRKIFVIIHINKENLLWIQNKKYFNDYFSYYHNNKTFLIKYFDMESEMVNEISKIKKKLKKLIKNDEIRHIEKALIYISYQKLFNSKQLKSIVNKIYFYFYFNNNKNLIYIFNKEVFENEKFKTYFHANFLSRDKKNQIIQHFYTNNKITNHILIKNKYSITRNVFFTNESIYKRDFDILINDLLFFNYKHSLNSKDIPCFELSANFIIENASNIQSKKNNIVVKNIKDFSFFKKMQINDILKEIPFGIKIRNKKDLESQNLLFNNDFFIVSKEFIFLSQKSEVNLNWLFALEEYARQHHKKVYYEQKFDIKELDKFKKLSYLNFLE